LINDLFPGISLDKAGYPELENAIESQTEESQLIDHPSWRLKLIQVRSVGFLEFQRSCLVAILPQTHVRRVKSASLV
jgi:hypothetical protein